jgi:hypothetical protein
MAIRAALVLLLRIQCIGQSNAARVRGGGLNAFGRTSTIAPSTILSDKAKPLHIPWIIHQSFKSTNLSTWKTSWLLALNSWTLQNPSWRYMFWLDAENRALFEKHLPKYLTKYDSFGTAISKADFSRFAYLYVHGGVYADLDVECLRPLPLSLATGSGQPVGVVLGMMGSRPSFEHAIPNAWMASVPRHPIWLTCMELAYQAPGRIEAVAGPQLLKKCVEAWTGSRLAKDGILPCATEQCKEAPPIKLLPHTAIYPFNWNNGRESDEFKDDGEAQSQCQSYCRSCTDNRASNGGEFLSKKCLELHRLCYTALASVQAAALTCWTHSWKDATKST